MKEKIAFVLPDLNYGGAQVMSVKLAQYINFDLFKIHFFIKGRKNENRLTKELKEKNIECTFLNLEEKQGIKKIFSKIKNYYIFKKHLKKFNPDLVHSHMDTFYSLLYCAINKKKILMTIHSKPCRIMNNIFLKLTSYLEKKNLIYFIGCAKCISDDLYNLNIVKTKERISTIYNPIDTLEYKLAIDREDDFFIFTHIGRLHPIKNQQLLIRAFNKVIKEYPQSRLNIVGDGDLKQDLQKKCKQLGIDSYVNFLGNCDDINEILRNSDVFILTSKSEACPITVLEALATGIPIISTDVGGVKEIVDEYGILVEEGNEDELIKQMKNFIKKNKEWKKRKNEMLNYVQKYDVKNIVKQYQNAYINCIENKT